MDASAQLVKGVLPLVTLAVLEAGDSYGYRVAQALKAAGLDTVGDASVYGTLQRLYDEGLASCYVAASESGPPRRYYSLTGPGSQALAAGRQTWSGFAGVIGGLLGAPERVPAHGH